MTAGEKGCYVSENGRVTHVPACKVTGEIDFCGAGDTFLSCLACATAGGFPLVDAATLACAASAVTIKKLRTTGTATTDGRGRTTYRDAMGRTTGTKTVGSHGRATYRDAMGRVRATQSR